MFTKTQNQFLWGAATSSHQIEGDNKFNDWWHFEKQGKIDKKQVSGKATDHWNRYKEDLRLAEELKLNTYRFSIEWSRLEPQEGQWDKYALEWYMELVQECERRKLLPMLTLHHFTFPKWISDNGGLTNKDNVHFFERYVKKVVKVLGSHVPLWCTINEPLVLVIGQYLGGIMPPAENNPKVLSLALRNFLKCHVAAYRAIHNHTERRKGAWRSHPLQVGIAHNMVDFMASKQWHPMERLLSKVFWKFYNQSFLDAVTGGPQDFGIMGLTPQVKPVREALGKRTVDFIGINYYMRGELKWRPKADHYERVPGIPVGISFSSPLEDKSDMGWGIHPEGLSRMLNFVQHYGLPIYITENGIADAEDKYRRNYILEHLLTVSRAIKKGADIRGYYYWSLLDNFEWIKGYDPRFGLVSIDYSTFERKIRPSAKIYRDLIQQHLILNRPPSEKIILEMLKKV